MRGASRFFIAAVLASAGFAHAVERSADGRGQALIFPYYTVRSSADGEFNTYVSILNGSQSKKAVRLAFREGRWGRSVFEMNIYLMPADMWAGALVPDAAGMRLVSSDASCTDPVIPTAGLRIEASAAPATSQEPAGMDIGRLREGYFEVLEMGVMPNPTGDRDCATRVTADAAQAFTRPTGSLSGVASLINVRNGLQFTYAATALDRLAGRAFFASPSVADSASFDSPAIDPVSVISFEGKTYRSEWPRGVDAVTAVLTARELEGEVVLDTGTRSRTEWVLTFPTRRFYVTRTTATPPFSARQITETPTDQTVDCENVYINPQSRDDARLQYLGTSLGVRTGSSTKVCWMATVAPFFRADGTLTHELTVAPSQVLGSANKTVAPPLLFGYDRAPLPIVMNGWAHAEMPGLSATAPAQILDHATGQTSAGVVPLPGLPVVGFSVHTLSNGFLDCAGTVCLGNYAGAAPLRARRSPSATN